MAPETASHKRVERHVVVHGNDSARLYNCAQCHSQVMICRHCDRGHIYCTECAPVARQDARNRAAARYQASDEGRAKHAARQRRYRERLKYKVTHKASGDPRAWVVLVNEWKQVKSVSCRTYLTKSESLICHLCSNLCSPFLRSNYLHSTV